jgi:hypothetical protein
MGVLNRVNLMGGYINGWEMERKMERVREGHGDGGLGVVLGLQLAVRGLWVYGVSWST